MLALRSQLGLMLHRLANHVACQLAGGDASKFARHSTRHVADESYIDKTKTTAVGQSVWPPKILPFEQKRGMISRMFNKLGLAGT